MKRLILAGAGHAHAQVLLDWAAKPMKGVELVVVSPQPLAPYSGMVPGWLAGAYRFEDIVIDFPRLCRAAGARWIEAEIVALDAQALHLQLSDGQSLCADVLSLNIGSTLHAPQSSDRTVLALRPLSSLQSQLEALLQAWQAAPSGEGLNLLAVGGGAAGFESVLALTHRFRQLRPDLPVQAALMSKSQTLLPGLHPAAQQAAARALAAAGVAWLAGQDAQAWSKHHCGLMLWATGAEAHDWLTDPTRRGSLAVSEKGFVRVDAQLRSVSHPRIFAVGDCAHWEATGQPLPKAGVYAVRMGPVLTANLRAALQGEAMQTYAPQRVFLALLATADGRAIASRGWWAGSGRWAWWLKDRIDRGFIDRFRLTS
jgi:pyridine nucleotide-disulfide oxidoreductase family protein